MKKLLFTAICAMAFTNGFASLDTKPNELIMGPPVIVLDLTFFQCLEFSSLVVREMDYRVEGGMSDESLLLEFNRNFDNCYSNNGGLLEK